MMAYSCSPATYPALTQAFAVFDLVPSPALQFPPERVDPGALGGFELEPG